jgi:hypothetical protein
MNANALRVVDNKQLLFLIAAWQEVQLLGLGFEVHLLTVKGDNSSVSLNGVLIGLQC